MKTPRGIRNNNPLNIRHSANHWQGVLPEQNDKSFVQFINLDYGYRAAWKILQSYYHLFCEENRPFTVGNIIHRWAPPSENDTKSYLHTLLRISGLGGNERLIPPCNPMGYNRLSLLLIAMTCVECGLGKEKVEKNAILNGYLLAFPENRNRLRACMEAEEEYFH